MFFSHFLHKLLTIFSFIESDRSNRTKRLLSLPERHGDR